LLALQVLNLMTRWYLLMGIFTNLLVISTYVITRTAAIPCLGPAAGEVEAVGVPDIASKSLELMMVVLLIPGLSPISGKGRMAFSTGS
jgi:hypothetical protein